MLHFHNNRHRAALCSFLVSRQNFKNFINHIKWFIELSGWFPTFRGQFPTYDNFPFNPEAKMEKNAWAENSLGLSPTKLYSAHWNITKEKENHPTVQAFAPFSSTSLQHVCPAQSQATLVPRSQMLPILPTPVPLHSYPQEMSALLYLLTSLPKLNPVQRPPLMFPFFPPTTPHPCSSHLFTSRVAPWAEWGHQ